MATVAVKNKYQVVIPRDVREAVGVEVGDLLDAKVEAGRSPSLPHLRSQPVWPKAWPILLPGDPSACSGLAGS
jgi:bifunctional DNA-binding transcriptional regulator/antitoxin component of YhaV-PrlF toxin-antitoxin module